MKISNKLQFNQAVGQYKLLSSTSGVGSLVTTKMGTFIMPMAIDSWKFIERANRIIELKLNAGEQATLSDVENQAVSVIDDPRFVRFLNESEGIPKLKYLVAIPQLPLDARNYLKVSDNPLFKKYYGTDNVINHQETFSIPAIVYPRWFYSEKTHKLALLQTWQDRWKNATGDRTLSKFAPPRDVDSKITKRLKDGSTDNEYGLLKQMPLILICKKGHISDIPWETFFRASLDRGSNLYEKGFDFEAYQACSTGCRCGGSHELTYTESQNKSSGWGVLKCTKCQEIVPLEGIMNLQPKCMKDTPWLGLGTKDSSDCKEDGTNDNSTMRVALLTSSGVYYTDQISSLYIKPSNNGVMLTDEQQELLNWVENTLYSNNLQSNPNVTRDSFWQNTKPILPQYAQLSGKSCNSNDIDIIEPVFLGQSNTQANIDAEQYRYDEYQIFTRNSTIDIPKLKFSDIVLDGYLSKYFNKICQVETLCITRTQMNFFRCELPQVKLVNGTIVQPSGMHLYGRNAKSVYAYPAIQDFGEGIFFEFRKNMLVTFSTKVHESAPERYNRRDYKMCSQLCAQLNKYQHAERFYMLHTFAHILIKELEFSCGYPSASLAERIYFSDRMCGVLIYTTDGSEGSMGGLVWQGKPNLIRNTIEMALERARVCSSDPICWEHDEETMNYAACFSCSMISETSCEYRNFGLDRKALIDDDFGLFSL